jgi:hypothetical protein
MEKNNDIGKSIDKMIIEHLDEMNLQEPADGHFERFEARLQPEIRRRTIRWNQVWRVAAAVVFIFLAVNQTRIWLYPQEKSAVTLAAISPEYAEIEYFYTSSIQNGIDSWNSLAATGLVSAEENQIMQQEFSEFERRYKEIQKELEANPYDERVINAMLEYYQAKLNVITMIVEKLMEVKQQKNISHEKEV